MPDLTRDEFQSLLSYMEWADATIWTTVLSLAEAREDEKIRKLLHHLHAVQHVYLQVARHQPTAIPELAEFGDLAAIRAWAQPYYGEARALLDGLTREDLSAGLNMPWGERLSKRFGPVGASTLAETLLQVVLHTSYHRGQVATRIRELGGDPPLTDFIAWVWQRRPGPAW